MKSDLMEVYLEDPQATAEIGAKLSKAIAGQRLVVYLQGDLGAGKTALCQAIIKSYGYDGRVKSPTYTLLEPYELPNVLIYHFDLYRLADPEELEFIGIRDLVSENALFLIEWPDKGIGFLPEPDLKLNMTVQSPGRMLYIQGISDHGEKIVDSL
ncbi:MAG: tRNA (adenosine(37)-N6)-threonylcarbamoyltransferase complex ATPase subunit type 1 TsaE [Pseudomonadales bacterium]|nr:tRNA (adenosine(37)-N6)-threonylcarbamoyltransferase complex ATPase subunit type 1 TsaE [Pseudomonadales bacterium]